MGCGGRVITKVEYIYPDVVVPEEPTYYVVQWQKVDNYYCVDIDNVKSLLKNYFILKAYKDELKLILMNIKELKGGEDARTYP